jgi:hypothetical protein
MAELVYQFSDEWRYERFLTTIEQLAGIPWVRAERAAQATMETLGERITAARRGCSRRTCRSSCARGCSWAAIRRRAST